MSNVAISLVRVFTDRLRVLSSCQEVLCISSLPSRLSLGVQCSCTSHRRRAVFMQGDLLAEGCCWAAVQSEPTLSLVLSPHQLLETVSLSWQCPAWLDLCWFV